MPRTGDFFQIGTLDKPGNWYYDHVGVIIDCVDDPKNPTWTTVEAGQGGPGRGFDLVKRKGPRLLNPVDPDHPKSKKELMGWLDIDEYFGGGGIQPAALPVGGGGP